MKVAKNDSLWNDWKLLINFFVKNLLQYMYIYIYIYFVLYVILNIYQEIFLYTVKGKKEKKKY